MPPVAASAGAEYAVPVTPFGSGEDVVIESGTDALFVRLKRVEKLPAVAVTVYAPAVPFAVKVGAVAVPLAAVVTGTEVPEEANVPLAPVVGAANVTLTPDTPLP